jgi:hypothetical protein
MALPGDGASTLVRITSTLDQYGACSLIVGRSFVDLPVGGVAMAVIFFFLHINTTHNNTDSILKRILSLDLLGLSMFLPAVICLILALQWGGAEYPWNDSRIIGLFVGAGVMALIFIFIQLRQGDDGTLPPKFFKSRNILCGMIFAFFFGAGFFPLVYYLCKYSTRPRTLWLSPKEKSVLILISPALYFQAIQGVSAVQAGIKILPLLIAVVVMSMLSGGLISAIGYYNVVVLPCMILFTVGSGLITTFSVDTPTREWFGYQVIAGMFHLNGLILNQFFLHEHCQVSELALASRSAPSWFRLPCRKRRLPSQPLVYSSSKP